MSTVNYAEVQRQSAPVGVFVKPLDFTKPLDKAQAREARLALRARRARFALYAREYRARRRNDGSVPDAFRAKQISDGARICATLTPEEKKERQRMLARLRQRACVARRKAAVPVETPVGVDSPPN